MNILNDELKSDLINRGFSRRNFGRIAAMITAGATLPFYNEPALAQLSKVNAPPDAILLNANENPLGPCKEAREAAARMIEHGGRYRYGEGDRVQAVSLDQAGRQEVVGVGERTHRVVGVAADDQGGLHRRLRRRTLQEVARLRKAREAPHRDMRHRVEAGMPQPGASGDDVVMRDAARIVDEYGHAGIEQLAQPLSGEVVARRNLDRARGDQFRNPVALHGEIRRLARLTNCGAHQPKPRLREMT